MNVYHQGYIVCNFVFLNIFHFFSVYRKKNGKTNRLHERCLRIIYSEKQSSFIKLLEKDNSVTIHQQNLQILATERYKVSKDLSLRLLRDILKLRSEPTYSLWQSSQFFTPRLVSVYRGTESVSFLGPKNYQKNENV